MATTSPGLITYNQAPTPTRTREVNVLITVDFSPRHEIVAGAKIITKAFKVLQRGVDVTGSVWTISNASISGDGKMVQVELTDVAAVETREDMSNKYTLEVDVTLDGIGTQLTEGVDIFVQ